jgi:hypothetical protein
MTPRVLNAPLRMLPGSPSHPPDGKSTWSIFADGEPPTLDHNVISVEALGAIRRGDWKVVNVALLSDKTDRFGQVNDPSKTTFGQVRIFTVQQTAQEHYTVSDVIQRAKDASNTLNSPPRIYLTSGNGISSWPNHPGSVEIGYGMRGIYHPSLNEAPAAEPMILTTVVAPASDANSWDVAFQCTWKDSNIAKRHAWKFHVRNDRATFLGEEGDGLPPLPL